MQNSSTVEIAGDDASAGAPNDAEVQLVLRNAHPLQDESLSLNERVNAFRSLEREAQETKARWKGLDPKPCCEECGRKHSPPHWSPEQFILIRQAFKKGNELRKELEQASNPAGPSQSDVTMAGADPSAPSTTKGKSVLCTRCAKWHPGGANACKTPSCTQGCELAHPPLEDCEHAAKRFLRVRESRKAKRAAPPTPSSSGAASSGSFNAEKLRKIIDSIPDTQENMNMISSLLESYGVSKRPAAELAKNTSSSQQQQQQKKKKKKRKTGQGGSCQGPQFHHKDPPKPDDGEGKGKERAQPEVKPEPAWE